MHLQAARFKQLHTALLNAFDLNDLETMMHIELGVDLNHITLGDNFEVIVRDVILWAEKGDLIPDLIQGASAYNKTNIALQEVAATFGEDWYTDVAATVTAKQLRNCLAPEQITEMASIGARHRMGGSARGMLFAFVDQEFYTRLEVHRNPRDQVESDLIALNLAAQLKDDSVPLKIWLQAAVNRLKHGSASDLRPFEKALNEVNAIILSGSPR